MTRHRGLVALVSIVLLGLLGMAVLPPVTPVAAAGLTLSRNAAAPGDQVTATGNGFHAGDSVVVSVDFTVGGNKQRIQAAATTGADGTFSANLTVPNGTAEALYHVTAQDVHGSKGTANLTVLPLVWLQAGQNRGPVDVMGDNGYYVRGAGFQPGESVTLDATFTQYNGNSVSVHRVVAADAKGNLPETGLHVPRQARAGTVTMTAMGASSKNKATTRINVLYRPYVSVNPRDVPPGGTFNVSGGNFVANSTVRVAVAIPNANGVVQTFSRSVGTDGNGQFKTSINLPGGTRPGTYTVTATGATAGFHASSRITLSVHAGITLLPNVIDAGHSFVVKGAGFAAGVHVQIKTSFATLNGPHGAGHAVTTNGSGQFSTKVFVPGNARTQTVTVTASGPSGQARARLTVRQKAAPPTATPKPAPQATAKPTAKPNPTPTPTPTATPISSPPTPLPTPITFKKHGFGYRYVSLWYHTVREGTWDHLSVQGSLKTRQGIWVHVIFPAGQHHDYYQNTDGNGFWQKNFNIPHNAISRYSSRAQITIQLWHGKKSTKDFLGFNLVH